MSGLQFSSWIMAIALLLVSCGGTPVAPKTYRPGELRDEYVLSRSDHHPEGAAFDEVSRAFFTGSLAHDTITRITVDGKESVFHGGSKARGGSTLGMTVDAQARRLWVCAIRDKKSQAGSVWVFDIETGRRTHDFSLEKLQKGASCNDVAIDSSGAAYVTDRQNPVIYRITADGEPAKVWLRHPLLEPGSVGLNGIAVTPDGSTLLVAHYKPSQLLRVSMRDPTDVSKVTLRGDAFSGGISLTSGADGLRFSNGALFVAFDRWVMRITSHDPSWRSATVKAKRISMKYGITAITDARGTLYAVNGQTAMFLLGLRPSLPFRLVRIDPALFDQP